MLVPKLLTTLKDNTRAQFARDVTDAERDSTPSFGSMLPTCDFTVRSLIPSIVAMSLFRAPPTAAL